MDMQTNSIILFFDKDLGKHTIFFFVFFSSHDIKTISRNMSLHFKNIDRYESRFLNHREIFRVQKHFLGLLMLKIAEMPHLNAFRRKSASLSGDSLHEYSQASMFWYFSKSPLLHSGPWYHISVEGSLIHVFFSLILSVSLI